MILKKRKVSWTSTETLTKIKCSSNVEVSEKALLHTPTTILTSLNCASVASHFVYFGPVFNGAICCLGNSPIDFYTRKESSWVDEPAFVFSVL